MDFKEGGEEYLRKMTMGYVSYVKGADNLTYAVRADQGTIPAGLYFTKVTKCKMHAFQERVYNSTLEEQKNAALTQHMTMVQSCLRNTSKLAEMIHARRAILIQNEKK